MTNVLDHFLDHHCSDVGWSFSGSSHTESDNKLELNYTTHNTNTREVLDCIQTITGKVPVKTVRMLAVSRRENIYCLVTMHERTRLQVSSAQVGFLCRRDWL